MQQRTQGGNTLWLRGDLLSGRQLVEHVDQCFMGLICLVEKPLAHHQTAFFNGAVYIEQGFAQCVDGLQLQQKRRNRS